MMSAAELQNYIASHFGRRPVERTIEAAVSTWLTNGGTTVKITSDMFHVTAITQAPNIEAAYYLTGSINGWNNTDTTYKLTNDGSDPYENPTFKVRIPAAEDGGNIEFKMTPESGLGGDWSGCLAAAEEEGKFNYDNAGGNMVITADPDALFYDLTFNMLDQTWTYAPVGFNEVIYEIGNESGWSEPHPLYGNGLGQYEAIIWLDGEFKFKPNKDNWDGDWEKASGDATGGTLTTDGGPNIDGVAAGFYLVQVDLKEMTYTITAVNSISIIGSVRGSWDTDIDMTYVSSSTAMVPLAAPSRKTAAILTSFMKSVMKAAGAPITNWLATAADNIRVTTGWTVNSSSSPTRTTGTTTWSISKVQPWVVH